MATQGLPQDVILVDVRSDFHKTHELDSVIEAIRSNRDRHVVVDFSNADIVGSPILAKLLELRELMQDFGCSLILLVCPLLLVQRL